VIAERILTETIGTSAALTFLRPFTSSVRANQPVIQSYRQNAVNFLGYNPRRQFVHEDDVASAFVRATLNDLPGAFNVASDDCVRLSDVWAAVGKKICADRSPAGRPADQPGFEVAFFLDRRCIPCWISDMLVDFTAATPD
jgi:nucleoside-diphosphate-sugar epimerase